MASTILRSPAGDARDTGRRVILPVMRGVTDIIFPRSTEAHALYNWKDGASAATVAGTVSYSAGYITTPSQNDRLQLATLDQNAMTFYAVARSGAAFSSGTTRPIIVGTYQSQSGGIAGSTLLVTGTPSAAPAATLSMQAARDNAAVPSPVGATLTVSNFSNWTLLVGACDNNTDANARRIYDKTNNTSGSATPASARLLSSGPGIRIGGTSSLTYGTVDIAAIVIANVAHTAAEIESNAVAIRRRLLAFHSITV
jgi:hypothetical protein